MQQTVYALAASPSFANDGIVFAAGEQGLFSSADGGHSWQPALDSLQLAEPLPITAVLLSPRFSSDRRVYAGAPGGVLSSSDGGATWFPAVLPEPTPTISALAISPDFERDGTLIAGSSADGIFRSIDRGAHWQPWNFGLIDVHVLAVAISPAFADDRAVFAGTESGIFRSDNGGRSWEECGFPSQLAPVLSLALSPGFAEDATLYAGTEQHGLYRSTDGGTSWVRLAEDQLTGEVAAIVVAADRMLLLGDRLLLGAGSAWIQLGAAELAEAELVSLAAPDGLAAGAPVLVGLAAGGVRRVVIDEALAS